MAETSSASESAKPAGAHHGFPWRYLITAALVVFLVIAGFVAWFFVRLSALHSSNEISAKFMEYLPTVGAADGILETATCSIPETFTRTDSAWLLNSIPLGTTVSEIRVPAIYRYHIGLYDPWALKTQGSVCIVYAPSFEPSLPPAIITDSMEKSTTAGWLRFNADVNLATLEKGITSELTARAGDKQHRDYVREASRQAVAEFVKNWLIKEDAWRQDRFHQVIVQFPDDPLVPGSSGVNVPSPVTSSSVPAATAK